MGFFYSDDAKPKAIAAAKGISIETLHRVRCRACPLNNEPLQHPKMEATGAKHPIAYILGEAPGAEEDKIGKQFVGDAGDLVRSILRKVGVDDKLLRWNNVLRCRPPKNRTPIPTEIECCRKFIEEDIERSKPAIIIGAGGIPLHWAVKIREGIGSWRGRRLPVKIGSHSCWFYPIWHPSFINRKKHDYTMGDVRLIFEKDLEQLAAAIKFPPVPPTVHTASMATDGVELLDDVDRIEWSLKELAKEPSTGTDVETHAKPVAAGDKAADTVMRPHAPESRIVSMAVAGRDRAVAFPISHPEWKISPKQQVRLHKAVKWFILHSGTKICHNLIYELLWFRYFYGRKILYGTQWGDTMAMGYALDERKGMLSLGTLTLIHFGLDIKTIGPQLNKTNLIACSLEDVLRYNAVDSRYTYLLGTKKLNHSVDHEKLTGIYRHLVRASPATVMGIHEGVPVNMDELNSLSKKFAKRVAKAQQKVLQCPESKLFQKKQHREFNPFSNTDLAVLFHKMLHRREVVTEKGGISTEESRLSTIQLPIAKNILRLRHYNKMHQTYIEGVRSVVYPDGKLHPGVNLLLTATGRKSYEDPSLQNFPKRQEADRVVRRYIQALPGYKIIAPDYGQIEARVIAMASEDENFIKALWTDFDIHMHWAERLLKLYPRQKDWIIKKFDVDGDDTKKLVKTLRTEMKNRWVFPKFFGARTESCAESLQIPLGIGTRMEKEFWGMFPGVQRWQKRVEGFYEKRGYVEMLTGRRRHGPIDRGRIINTPIQGTASDIVVDAENALSEAGYVIIINIHDQLFHIVPEKEVKQKAAEMAKIMCTPRFDFIMVPLLVEVEVGQRWDQLEEYRKWDSFKDFGLPKRS